MPGQVTVKNQVRVSPSTLYEYVMNDPGAVTEGFFAATGRSVITLPSVAS